MLTLLIALLVLPMLAAFTHTVSNGWTNGNQALSGSSTQTSSLEINIDESVPANTTDQLINCAFAYANLKSIFILSTQDMTLETNSASSPGNTIALKANVPYVWQSGAYGSNPFTVNVSALYLTNATATAATLQLRALVDATP